MALTQVPHGMLSSDLQNTPYGYKNKLINGDMRIWQRGGSFSGRTWSNTYSADRWCAYTAGASNIAITQDTDVPANQGFLFSHKSTVTATASSSAYYTILQRIEGYHITDMFAGRTGCQAHTISFWFKASVQQTYSGSARIGGASSCYAFDFTPTAVNTWQKVVINVPANTTTAVTVNNGEAYSLCITPFLYSSVGLNGTANTWVASNIHASSNVGSTWGNTAGATFYLTGVQVEIGSTATNYDFKDYTTELLKCQRYYFQNTGNGSGVGYMYHASTADPNVHYIYNYRTQMRTTPTVTLNVSNTTAIVQFSGVDSCEAAATSPGTSGEARITSIYVDAEI